VPWIKGNLLGQKVPLRISETWAIRVRFGIYDPLRGFAFEIALT
jgi:hypothetical protein